MRKLLSLIALLIVGLVPIMADDSSDILKKGDRVSWDAVTAGDRLLLNNATGTLNMAYPNCKFSSVDNVFLNAVQHQYTTEGARLDVSAATLSSDNIFVLVAAPEQHEGVPSYYLQHEASKKYIHCEESNGRVYMVEGSNDATSFEVIGALSNYEPDSYGSWLTTGNVDDETAVFVHYVGETKYHLGPFWNYGWTYYGTATDIIPWNLYRPVYSNKAVDKLPALLDQIKTENKTFTIGTAPGYYPEDKVTDFEQVYIEVDQYLADDGDAEDKCQTYYDNLKAAYEAVQGAFIKVTDGYYNFINDYDNYESIQGVKKAMSASPEGKLTWQTFDPKDPTQLFKVTSLGDDTYSIQNVATGEYINTIAGQSSKVPMSSEQTTPQIFTFIANSTVWNIANTVNTMAYHTENHNSGNGISGDIVTWDGGAGSASAWEIYPVTDQHLIDSLLEAGPKQVLVIKFENAITAAKAARSKANDYTALITSADQINSNSISYADAGSTPLANLIDGSTNTIFHSIWDNSMASNITTGTGWHNLQFNLGKEVANIRFTFTGRDNSSGWHDNPTHITLYGTNDDELGASTAAADSSQWTEIVDMTKDAYGFPGNDNLVSYESPVIDMNGSYKYLRFVVKRVSTMDGGKRATAFWQPSLTGVTFNLSEFQIYDGTPTANSEYYTVSGMKEACDELDKLVAEAQTKISSLTVTEEDIAAMNAITDKVSGLYVDRSAFDAELAELKEEATSLYNTVTGSRFDLITDASQFSSNNSSESENSSFAHLLDDETLHTHNFHSAWIGSGMKNADITAEEWEQALSDNNVDFTGHGYHNLQVKLNQPVSSFYFEYIARTGTKYVDNPTDIEVYVTNDDELGASTDQADIDKWTKLTELTEGFPNAEAGAKYTSPTLQLEDGSTFKYVRFVIKNTALAGKSDFSFSRTFANPDITGITWNVATWRMYSSGLTKERMQYEYIAGMKEACDAMTAILDEANKMGSNEMINSEFNDKFAASISAVRTLIVDTTDVVALYNKYVGYADKSVVSEENTGIGYADSEESIEAFRTALASAKNGIDPVSPTKAQIDAATASMKEAFKTFMSHVGQLEPNKWYNIFGGSLRDYTQGQPVYLTSTSTGDQLHIGGYPIDEVDPTIDPYAIWRLVPIEGQEPSDDYSIGCYAIQNMGTGQYFGVYRGQGATNSPVMSHEKTPYNIYYYGNGKFKMQQVGVADDFDCLKTDNTNFVVLNYPADGDEQQSFIFQPLAEDHDAIAISYYFDNSLNTMVVPWAVSNLSLVNTGVKTYAVKSFTTTETGSRLELKEKESFEAGEPFIILVNDYTNCDNIAKQPVVFNTPQDVTDTSAIVANGLVGTLEGMTVVAPGMGIFTYDSATTSWMLSATSANYFLSGRYAYLDPKKVVNEEGDADLIIDTDAQITGVKSFTVTKATEKVNVYSIDGKLIKRNVKAIEAGKGLNKGIYIIGKKKISVK